MYTYIAINTKNGKFYVGSTTNFEQRKHHHLIQSQPYPFQRALQKDPDSFEWEVFFDESEDPVLEQALLDMFYGKSQCYNLSPFAGRPPVMTKHKKETVEKMSQTRRSDEYREAARNRTLKQFEDKSFREFHRRKTKEGCNKPGALEKLSEKSKERWSDPDYRERMREAHRGKGLPWWVKENGTTTRSQISPGPEWQKGRKWKPQ